MHCISPITVKLDVLVHRIQVVDVYFVCCNIQGAVYVFCIFSEKCTEEVDLASSDILNCITNDNLQTIAEIIEFILPKKTVFFLHGHVFINETT